MKIEPPHSKKVFPLFPSNLPLKVEVLPSPPFWKFGWRFRKGGSHVLCNWIFRCRTLGQKKEFCFWKLARWKFFYNSFARVVQCVPKYIYFIWKNKETSKQKKNTKKQNKLKKKREYLWKIDKKNNFAASRVKIFLVTRISGNKSF